MKRVHAVGFYGWGNFGDELFRAAIDLNKEQIWGEGVIVKNFVTPVDFLHQNVGPIGSTTRILELAIGSIWADTIALCGGSLLEDVRGTERLRRSLARHGKSVVGLGVSLGPWSSSHARQRVKEYVETMDTVVVRDRASMDRIGGQVVLGGDLAALYPMPITREDSRDYLTICVSRDSGSTVEELFHILSRLLPLVRMPVKLLALNVRPAHGDVELTRELRDRLSEHHPDVQSLEFESIDQTVEIISKSRSVWSQRLHGLIVAYLCKVPVLALSHHQKIADFAEHIGLSPRFVRHDLEVDDDLLSAAAESINNPTQWSLSPDTYRRLTAAAITNFDWQS